MLDAGYIRIGKHTLIEQNCLFYTPQHPMDHVERREEKETAYPIIIGEDCWLGGGMIVCPGVTIGNRCIIAAGSVVTKDIPDDSLAAGVLAVVKKSLKKGHLVLLTAILPDKLHEFVEEHPLPVIPVFQRQFLLNRIEQPHQHSLQIVVFLLPPERQHATRKQHFRHIHPLTKTPRRFNQNVLMF